MGGDPRKLAANHADGLPARRQFPAHELFDRHGVGDVVRQRRQVIQPVRVRHELVVGHVLRDLLVPAMQVADIRRRLGDDLAIEFEHHAQDAVGRRMRRAHVENELFAEDICGPVLKLREPRLGSGEGIRRFDFVDGRSHGKAAKRRRKTVGLGDADAQGEFVKNFTSVCRESRAEDQN